MYVTIKLLLVLIMVRNIFLYYNYPIYTIILFYVFKSATANNIHDNPIIVPVEILTIEILA